VSEAFIPIPEPTNQVEFDEAMLVVMERMRPKMLEHLLAECAAQPWLRPASVMELMVILAMSGVYAYAGRERTLACVESQRVNYERMPDFDPTGTIQ
jgi:hypothetical protein